MPMRPYTGLPNAQSVPTSELQHAHLFDVVLVSNDVYGRQHDLFLVNIREVSVSD